MSLETYVIKGSTKVIDRFFDLPLDYNDRDGPKIKVFVRHLIPLDKAKTPQEQEKLPYCGPGSEVALTSALALAPPIHEQGYQTLWLDQRGTGLSTPFSADLVQGKSDQEIFEYLKHFRADNIVRDCEAIRKILLGARDPEEQKWTILGQSFGGFCSLTYLSFFPEGLKEVFITGGLAPLIDHPDPAYLALEKKVTRKNQIYYQKYPADIKRVRDLLTFLDSNEITLPNGGTLTSSRFLQLGMEFGSKGGIDRVHQLVLRSSNDLDLYGKLSYALLQSIQATQTLDSNPIFAILHEPIYCQGRASNWSAERILRKFPQYQWSHVKHADADTPVYFFGEMILPSMFDDFANLRPLKGAAELLARHSDWPKVYDLDQLAKNEVKVTTATYYDDIYVEFGLSQEAAAAVKNTEQYISNEYFHGAIRTDGPAVFKQLFNLSKREYD